MTDTLRLEHDTRRWRAFYAGHVIADTTAAIVLHHPGRPPTIYFPRRDVSMEYAAAADQGADSPGLGRANFYTLLMDGHLAENAMWSYERPEESYAALAGHVAFDPSRVEIYEFSEAVRADRMAERRREVDEIVQHTDSGGGRSQREHWPPNIPSQDA